MIAIYVMSNVGSGHNPSWNHGHFERMFC